MHQAQRRIGLGLNVQNPDPKECPRNRTLGFGVWGLGFRVLGFGFWAWGLGLGSPEVPKDYSRSFLGCMYMYIYIYISACMFWGFN